MVEGKAGCCSGGCKSYCPGERRIGVDREMGRSTFDIQCLPSKAGAARQRKIIRAALEERYYKDFCPRKKC